MAVAATVVRLLLPHELNTPRTCMRDAYARATRARRNTRRNAARCNALLAPAFGLDTVRPEGVELLGAAQCDHCKAQLFEGELAASKRGKKRGAVLLRPRSRCPETTL